MAYYQLGSRLNPKTSDRLLRVRAQGKGITKHDFQKLFKPMKGSKEQTLEKKDF
jgi:C4-dicarboxylate-specific signal transduction histidine kinase